MLHIGAVLKQLRELTGKSKATVSREMGIPHSQISKYELGQAEPRDERLLEFAKYYGIDLAQLKKMQGQKKSDVTTSDEITIEFFKSFFLQSLAKLDSRLSGRSVIIAFDELIQSFDDLWLEHEQKLISRR